MKKSQKGFTLVELIVVIAIIGVLAAILVPAMVGYIKDSKLSSANSSAKTVYTAVNNACQKALNKGTPIKTGTYTVVIKSGYKSSAATKADIDLVAEAIGETLNEDANNSVAKIEVGANHFPSKVQWAKTKDDTYVGSYPKAEENETAALGVSSNTFTSAGSGSSSGSSSGAGA